MYIYIGEYKYINQNFGGKHLRDIYTVFKNITDLSIVHFGLQQQDFTKLFDDMCIIYRTLDMMIMSTRTIFKLMKSLKHDARFESEHMKE